MPILENRPLSADDRRSRAGWWPIYIPKIYLAVRRNGTTKTRFQTWAFAARWFHAWVWNYAELPW